MTPSPTSTTDPPAPATGERLPRRLGAWSGAAIVVGVLIGSGIFAVPSIVARHIPSPAAGLGLWAVGGVIALAGALAIAELGAMDPRTGGIFVYVRETYGRVPAFLFGWTDFLITRPASMAAFGMIFAGYLGAFVPLDDAGRRAVTMGLTLVLAAAHYRSSAWGAAIQNASSAAKFAALLLLAGAIFLLGDPARGTFAGFAGGGAGTTVAGVGAALIAVTWAYDGWADVAAMTGEMREPGRNLPRAVIYGVGGVLVAYLIVNVAYYWVLTPAEIGASTLVAADAATRVFGRAGASLVAALVMLATFGAANSNMMTGPRFVYAMADDGLFFRRLAAVHPRHETPHVAIAWLAALSMLYASNPTFEQLTSAVILGEWPFYTLAVAAVIVLRRRHPAAARPYRMPLVPLLPALFVLASLLLMGGALVGDTLLALASFGVIASGLPAYLLWRRLARHGEGD